MRGDAPNPRVQRTRPYASLRGSPLTRHPLGVRKICLVTISMFVMAASWLQAAEGSLSLRVAGAAHVQVGQPLSLRLTASNVGKSAFYFKQPWKWGRGGMRIVARATDRSLHESTTENFDIDAQYTCTFSKPLSPGDQFSFEVSIVIAPKPVLDPSSPPPPEVLEMMIGPHLDLPPGKYKVRWVYEPALFAYDLACAVADVPVWRGHAESQEIDLDVRK